MKLGARALLAAGLFVSATLAPPRVRAEEPTATAEAKAGARAAAEKGTNAFKESRYDEAVDMFLRAESLFHAPTHVLMLARSYVALGKLVLAKEAYHSIVREELAPKAPAAFKLAKVDAEKELAELSPRIPSLQVSTTPEAKNVVVTLDDKPLPAALIGIPSPIDPGTHVLRATAEGMAAPEKSVTVKEGEKAAVVLELAPVASAGPITPVPRPLGPTGPSEGREQPSGKTSPGRIAGVVLMGLGVAGLGAGGVFGGLSLAKRAEADETFDACGVGCWGPPADEVRALDDDANKKGNIGIIGLAAGGALTVTGIVLFVVSKRSPGKAQAKAFVTPWIAPQGGGVVGRF
ncbi:hypothetical protein [Polyangium jinanense]|uniref:PEGA domain-containing protein n=1 Tax=Polyangium jinanense TaxID=2829994 RepID=A0A9X3XF39_9BACT|nr:hypothetical protein [Polyangium jinanense]MDC3958395.1 hypothetical protein [Polyangium jinanense]MDC3988275.1 hypothetical protein [Polyangium jinanense]